LRGKIVLRPTFAITQLPNLRADKIQG